MDRRGLLRALLALPLAGASWLAYAQKKGMAMVEELQQNWKTFLAAGTAVPAATAITATYSRTDRRPPGYATATTAWR